MLISHRDHKYTHIRYEEEELSSINCSRCIGKVLGGSIRQLAIVYEALLHEKEEDNNVRRSHHELNAG